MQLNYKSFGEGTPVVILHGLFGSLDNWQTIARKLSDRFKVYIVDLRNHGKSPHSAEHSYPLMSADLKEFFDGRHIDKAFVIGHSMGGKVAMQFAIEHPEKIIKLVVVDIAPRAYGKDHDLIFGALMSVNLSDVKKREDADKMLAEKVDSLPVRQFLLKNLDRQHDGSFKWKMNLQGLSDNYHNMSFAITSSQPVAVPAVVIRGGNSDYVNDQDLDAFRKIFPRTTLITISGAGHWVHAEAPEEFLKVVQEVLREEK